MVSAVLGKIKRGLKKPPRYIAWRLIQEFKIQTEKYIAPRRADWFTDKKLLQALEYPSLNACWEGLSARPFVACLTISPTDLNTLCPGEVTRIFDMAEKALAHEVDLLGSGPVKLGESIDWHRDYKSGYDWPRSFCHAIEYNNPERPSDVKFPWEVSRMQWMIPLGQAYVLTQDERYATEVRNILLHWMDNNPHAFSVNWSCTMDVALRLITWTWFFHVFKKSRAFEAEGFRSRFLKMLYLHGDFTARNLEKSDINGNHYAADAAGLVFAGLFFGQGAAPQKWQALGWNILNDELPRQVFADGVDFEASIPYHRLVQELFFLPALYRMQYSLPVSRDYRERIMAMARFTEAYTRCDGSIPLIGDADDARTLPFGGQAINDHRYLLAMVGIAFQDEALSAQFSGSMAELIWLFGPEKTAVLNTLSTPETPVSKAFEAGGFYILRNACDHILIDCGPLGLGGRGGHGHNDLLSFEAMLNGVHLVSDCGAWLYTANYQERNLFRSTAYHNTPQIDGEEINRFISADSLWSFHNDADYAVKERWFDAWEDTITVVHTGYQRLPSPVTVERKFTLNHTRHRLRIVDTFTGSGKHQVRIPLHLAPGLQVQMQANNTVHLLAQNQVFILQWQSDAPWKMQIEKGRISPTYGVIEPVNILVWSREDTLTDLSLEIYPC